VLNPTKEQVAQMVTRLALGPEKESEWLKLHQELLALDFRDYPESYAQVVGEAGWLYDVAQGFKQKFAQNDDPAFVEAMIAYYEREHDKLPTGHERIQYPQLLARMTNSPTLIPALVKGLDSSLFSGCLAALESFQTAEAARALIERAKAATTALKPGEDTTRLGHLHYSISLLRNPELNPYLEQELAQTKDPALALQIRAAITGTKQGWPRVLQPEHWKQLTTP
jgi:hypothetical protein